MDKCYLKTTPLLAVKEHPLTCSLYILNVLANHQLQVIKVPHLYPLPNQLVFELILYHKFTPVQCRKNKFKKLGRDQFRSSWYDLPTDGTGRFNIHCAVCMFAVSQKHSCLARVHRQYLGYKLSQTQRVHSAGLYPFGT